MGNIKKHLKLITDDYKIPNPDIGDGLNQEELQILGTELQCIAGNFDMETEKPIK